MAKRERGVAATPSPNNKLERGEYRAIFEALVDSAEFQALSATARACFWPLKLKLGRAGIAVFYVQMLPQLTGFPERICEGAVEELRRSFEPPSEGVNGTFERAWLFVEGNVFWLRNGLKFDPTQPLASENGRKSIIRYLQTLPKLNIVNRFALYYNLLPIPFEGASDPLPKTNPLRTPFEPPTEAGMRDEGIGMRDNGEEIHPKASSSVDGLSSVTATVVTKKNAAAATAAAEDSSAADNSGESNARSKIDDLITFHLDRLKAAGWTSSQLKSLKAQCGPIMNGLDANVWRDEGGTVVPWEKRPALLELAICRYEGEPDRKLRSHLRYVIPEQLHPHELKNGATTPMSPVNERPQERGARSSGFERVGAVASPPDAQVLSRWEQEHPAEVLSLRAQAEHHVATNPEMDALPDVIKKMAVSTKYGRLLEAVVAAETSRKEQELK